MIDNLYMSATVYDCDGIIAASFVGDYETLRNVFAASVDDKHCPPYFQKRIHDGFVKITDYQLIVSQKIVSDDKWVYPCIPVSDLVLPFDVFIRGDFGGDEPLGALLEYAFEYRRKSEEEQHG